MKKALLIWGGWSGHKPDEVAERLSKELEHLGVQTTVTSNFGILLDGALDRFDVIVPIWSCGISSDIYLSVLLEAIEKGVGLATFHGGIDWFTQQSYSHMIGGSYRYDTKEENFQVLIKDKDCVITQGIEDYQIFSEKYFLDVDPENHVLAIADDHGDEVPIVWTRNFGEGRVFYSSLAHSPESIFQSSNMELLLKGILWCAGCLDQMGRTQI